MKNDISIIGVPMDLGQCRRGVDMGPSAIRYAGIIERLEDLNYNIHDLEDVFISRPPRSKQEREDRLRNLDEVAAGNNALAHLVDEEINKGRFPLVLGGDH